MSAMKNEQPLVSVMVTAYNCNEFIDGCIQSVVEQTYRNIEIVIMDDHSTDGTYEKLQNWASRHQNMRLFRNPENMGYLRTFNAGITKCSGDYISFIDSDDLIDRRKVELQVEKLQSDNRIGFCGTAYKKIDCSGKVIEAVVLPDDHDTIARDILDPQKLPIIGSSVMVRKDVLGVVGGYKEFYVGCAGEDIDWASRLVEVSRGANIDQPLYYYRFRLNSLTRRVFTTPKQRHTREIISFLASQRKEHNGKDSLNSDLPGLADFLSELEQPYIRDKGLMYRKMAFDHAVNGHYLSAFGDYGRSVMGSINMNTFKVLAYIIILMIVPKSFLLKIMHTMNMKNISRTV
jgi:glycosyltransferase involved in cell wall biosynthesis